MVDLTVLGYPIQQLLMPMLLALLAWMLAYKPGHFAPTILGVLAFLLTPPGTFFMGPHASQALDYTVTAFSPKVSAILTQAAGGITGSEANQADFGSFLNATLEETITGTMTTLNITYDRVLELGIESVRQAADEFGGFTDITDRWAVLLSNAVENVFNVDLWGLMPQVVKDILGSPEFRDPVIENATNVAMSVASDPNVQQKLIDAVTGAIADVFADGEFIEECVAKISTQAEGFTNALSVSGAKVGMANYDHHYETRPPTPAPTPSEEL